MQCLLPSTSCKVSPCVATHGFTSFITSMLCYLLHTETSFVHIAQVEHGLCIVLLLRRHSIMHRGRLVVYLRAVAVVVVVADFHSCHSVACTNAEFRYYTLSFNILYRQRSSTHTGVEQGLTSHQTHYRSYRGWVFYGSNDPTNSVKALKEDRS